MQIPKLSHIYHGALAVGALALLWIRREPFLSGTGTTFDLLVFAIAAALLLAPLFKEVSLGGVKLTREIEKTRAEIGGKISELRATIVNSIAVSPTFNVQLQEMVHREVSRAQQEALRLMAAIDLELVLSGRVNTAAYQQTTTLRSSRSSVPALRIWRLDSQVHRKTRKCTMVGFFAVSTGCGLKPREYTTHRRRHTRRYESASKVVSVTSRGSDRIHRRVRIGA